MAEQKDPTTRAIEVPFAPIEAREISLSMFTSEDGRRYLHIHEAIKTEIENGEPKESLSLTVQEIHSLLIEVVENVNMATVSELRRVTMELEKLKSQ